MSKRRAAPPCPKGSHVLAKDVMKPLWRGYGPVAWSPRYDPASELVYTILRSTPPDINSERAYDNLMESFGLQEVLAEAPLSASKRPSDLEDWPVIAHTWSDLNDTKR